MLASTAVTVHHNLLVFVDFGSEFLQELLSLLLVDGLACGDVPTQCDFGTGFVNMLSTWSRATTHLYRELCLGEDKIIADGYIVHGDTEERR